MAVPSIERPSAAPSAGELGTRSSPDGQRQRSSNRWAVGTLVDIQRVRASGTFGSSRVGAAYWEQGLDPGNRGADRVSREFKR